MSTEAQLRANQANAQLSTGPTSPEGKAASSRNNLRYGLTGSSFSVLPWENEEDYDILHCGLQAQLKPTGPFEHLLIEKMAQHQWLAQRALVLQNMCFDRELPHCHEERTLALYLRYQTTHERAYSRYFNDLLKLRAEKRKQEIGFESQAQKRNEQTRRDAVLALRQSAENRRLEDAARSQRAENRKIERHRWDLLLAEAKVNHQMVLTSNLELDRTLAEIAQTGAKESRKAA